MTWIIFDNAIEFARLVASMDDADLFNDIYDSYNMFFTNGHYGGNYSIFYNNDYLEILLDHEHLFNSIFETTFLVSFFIVFGFSFLFSI